MQTLHTFFLGLLLSFLGQLPLGTLSMIATQIAIQENFRNAWKYALGVAIIEMIYLYGVLMGMHWIREHEALFNILNWLAVIFFLVLGTGMLITARKNSPEKKAVLLNNNMDRFAMGAVMSALNPAQIPFWFIWTAYFLSMGWLQPGLASYRFFIIGTGVGTVAGLAAYMYGGSWLIAKMKTGNRTLNTIMGVVFLIAAAIQVYRIMRH